MAFLLGTATVITEFLQVILDGTFLTELHDEHEGLSIDTYSEHFHQARMIQPSHDFILLLESLSFFLIIFLIPVFIFDFLEHLDCDSHLFSQFSLVNFSKVPTSELFIFLNVGLGDLPDVLVRCDLQSLLEDFIRSRAGKQDDLTQLGW